MLLDLSDSLIFIIISYCFGHFSDIQKISLLNKDFHEKGKDILKYFKGDLACNIFLKQFKAYPELIQPYERLNLLKPEMISLTFNFDNEVGLLIFKKLLKNLVLNEDNLSIKLFIKDIFMIEEPIKKLLSNLFSTQTNIKKFHDYFKSLLGELHLRTFFDEDVNELLEYILDLRVSHANYIYSKSFGEYLYRDLNFSYSKRFDFSGPWTFCEIFKAALRRKIRFSDGYKSSSHVICKLIFEANLHVNNAKLQSFLENKIKLESAFNIFFLAFDRCLWVLIYHSLRLCLKTDEVHFVTQVFIFEAISFWLGPFIIQTFMIFDRIFVEIPLLIYFLYYFSLILYCSVGMLPSILTLSSRIYEDFSLGRF